MRLRRLALEGFGSYQQRCELDLTDVKLAAICGLNGAGKSTLLDSVVWCLYGVVPGATNAQLLNLHDDVNEMSVEIEFDHEADATGQVLSTDAQHVHQVTRKWKHSDGRSTSAAQHLCDGDTAATGAKNVTESVVQVLGADVSTLTATMMSRQFEHGMFNSLRPGERQKLLRKPLPLDEWKAKQQAAEYGYQETERALTEARQHLSLAQQSADRIPDLRLEALTANLAAADATSALADVQGRAMSATDLNYLQQAEAAAAAQPALLKRHNTAKQRLSELAEALDLRNVDYTEAVLIQETQSDAYYFLEKREGECAGRVDSTRRPAAEAQEHQRLLDGGGLHECWMCQQPLTPTHYQQLKQKLQVPVLEHELAEAELASVRRQVLVARESAEQAKRNEQQLSQECVAMEAEIQRCEQEVALTEASLAANDGLLTDLDALRTAAANRSSPEEIAAAEETRTAAQHQAGALSERLLANEEAASQVEAHEERVQVLSREIEGLSLLRRAYAPSGIPRLAARSVMRGVALAANTTMRRLGSSLEMRLAGFSGIEAHDDTTSDDEEELSDELAVEARASATEPWRPYATFSGGERLRMDVASRLALIYTLGVRCSLLTFDEGWGNLDAPGRQAFVSLLHELVVNGEVRQVLTISHVAETLEKFDAFISVTYDQATGSHAEVVTGAAPATALAIAEPS